MQNEHNSLLLFWCSNLPGGGGKGSTRLEQNPKFCKKKIFWSPLKNVMKPTLHRRLLLLLCGNSTLCWQHSLCKHLIIISFVNIKAIEAFFIIDCISTLKCHISETKRARTPPLAAKFYYYRGLKLTQW